MISQQMWLYIGWVIFAIFVISIIAVSYAMYRDYQLTKNRQTSLPSLDVITSSEKKNIFVSDETSGSDAPAKTNQIPSRRALRGARAAAPAPSSPAVSAKPSSFFDDDDDDEFTLTAGTD